MKTCKHASIDFICFVAYYYLIFFLMIVILERTLELSITSNIFFLFHSFIPQLYARLPDCPSWWRSSGGTFSRVSTSMTITNQTVPCCIERPSGQSQRLPLPPPSPFRPFFNYFTIFQSSELPPCLPSPAITPQPPRSTGLRFSAVLASALIRMMHEGFQVKIASVGGSGMDVITRIRRQVLDNHPLQAL